MDRQTRVADWRNRVRREVAWVLMCAGLAGAACGCDPPAPRSHIDAGAVETPQPTAPGTVEIRKPAGPPTILTGAVDDKGQPVAVGCTACHTTKPANNAARLGSPLTQFHQGLIGKHGNLACTACHNPVDGYDSLRLADGTRVPYSEVMTLCAQCHGPQFRDYQHGAHGGMTGHWDLKKGGRVRNNCIDCHDPHAPKYPTVTPAPGPNDRFQQESGHE